MYRDAEKQLKSALRDQDMVDSYLYLCKVYVRLDQPLTAIDCFQKVSVYLTKIVANQGVRKALSVCLPQPIICKC